MMRKVSMFMLLFLVSSLPFGSGGCVDVEGETPRPSGPGRRSAGRFVSR